MDSPRRGTNGEEVVGVEEEGQGEGGGCEEAGFKFGVCKGYERLLEWGGGRWN